MRIRPILLLYILSLAALAILSVYTLQTYEVPHRWPALQPRKPAILNDVPLEIIVTWNSRRVPYFMKQHLEGLQASHPEFTLYIYSHDECREFIQRWYSADVLHAYDSLIPGAYRSDLFRYCKLYKDGGVYTDIKFIFNKPLINLIERANFHVIQDDQTEVPGCMCNGFLISPPNNPVFAHCIETIVKNCEARAYNRNALHITGPCVLGDSIREKMPHYRSPYQFRWATRKVYDANGKEFMTEYPEYRVEQKRHMVAVDYREAWTDKKVYRAEKKE